MFIILRSEYTDTRTQMADSNAIMRGIIHENFTP